MKPGGDCSISFIPRDSAKARLAGPAQPQANGYQFTFLGNYVHCTVEPMNFRWGITIDDSSYGLIKDNISRFLKGEPMLNVVDKVKGY